MQLCTKAAMRSSRYGCCGAGFIDRCRGLRTFVWLGASLALAHPLGPLIGTFAAGKT